jgi:gliding motility-associated-like protein
LIQPIITKPIIMKKTLPVIFSLLFLWSIAPLFASANYKTGAAASLKKSAITKLKPAAFTFNPIPAKVYGVTDFAPGATGGTGTTTYTSDNTAVATIVSGKIHVIAAGSANISATNDSQVLSQPLTVSPAPLTISVTNKTMKYGATVPALTINYSGFKNGDTQSVISVAPTASTTGTSTSDASTYPITTTGGTASNYTITYASSILTINQAPLTITAASTTKIYGKALPAFTVTYMGFKNGNTASVLTTAPTISTTATASSHVNTYPITPAGAAAKDYIITYVNGTLNISPASLTITAASKTKIYGAALPALTLSYAGFVNGDTADSLATPASVNTTALASSAVYTYPITVSNAASPNYSIKYVNGTLTINKVALKIAAVPVTVSYGQPMGVLGATYTGFVNGDTFSSLNPQPTFATTATQSSAAGSYTITVSAAADSNYTISYTNSTYRITAAPLTITADNKFKIAGQTNPVLSVTYSGFVNGDAPVKLKTQPLITTTALTGSPAGTYPITPKGAVDANYTITYVAGTLTVSANTGTTAPPTISYGIPPQYSLTEGQAFSVSPTNTGGAVPSDNSLLITTAAGSGNTGYLDTTALLAQFKIGSGGVTEFNNIIYIADQGNNVIRQVINGVVSTLAGSGTPGLMNLPGKAAEFNQPTGIACDALGNIYVSDKGNNVIREITPAGIVSTYAGTGAVGATDGTHETATFNGLAGITLNRNNGVMYVLDVNNSKIRRVYTTQDVVSTVTTNAVYASQQWITIYGNGSAIYTTGTNNLVTQTRIAGQVVSTFAGSGSPGGANGQGTSASFNSPEGITADPNTGTLYVADAGNNIIREIDQSQNVTTYAGNGSKSENNGNATTASLNTPEAIFVDNGTLYIGVSGANTIRETGFAGYTTTSTFPAGLSLNNNTGVISGTPIALSEGPLKISAFNAGGASSTSIFLVINNSVDTTGMAKIYTIAGNGADTTAGNGGIATSASFKSPYATAIDKSGNIYVASYGDFTIRKINATTKVVTLLAGTPGVSGFSGDGGPATSATLNIGLTALACDASGNVYVSDYYNNRIREINVSTGIITTIAGSGNDSTAYQGDGVVATQANLYNPEGLAFDSKGNLYFVDAYNSVVRKINVTTKAVTTIAGGGSNYLGGPNLPPTSVGFLFVERLEMINGNLYIPDESNAMVYELNTTSNIISTVAGNGVSFYGGDGSAATSATLQSPIDVAGDAAGNLYIVDQNANVIRKVDATTQNMTTYCGLGIAAYIGDGGPSTLAGLYVSSDIKTDKNGYLIVTDLGNQVIRRIGGAANTQTITFPVTTVTYGLGDFAPKASVSSGLPLTFTSSNTAIATIGSSIVVHIVTAGTDTITAIQAGNANFQPVSLKAKLTINKAPLTITANNATKVAGTPNPPLTFGYSGFVYSDTSITKAPTIKTTALTSSPAGTYPINLTNAVSNNYTLTFVNGVLTVTAAPVGLTLADEATAPNVKTAVTPNGDGINDVLTIDNIGKYPDNKITIVNNSGTKIFEAAGYDNVNKTFDGHSSITGAKQQAGTYFYVLEYKDNGVSKTKSGYISLKY